MNVTFPKAPWPLDEPKWKAIQKWIDQMKDLLRNNISYAANMNSEVVVVDFQAGSTPTKRTAITTRPLGVLLLSLAQTSPLSNAAPTVADAFSWTYSDGGLLGFPSLGTITGTARYRATVLVIKG